VDLELGYNTNGFTSHRLTDALRIISEIGYGTAAITIDHAALDPWSTTLRAETQHIRRLLAELNLCSVIETGARFLLDPRVKHQPSLLSSDVEARKVRSDLLRRSMEIAVDLESEAVSFWSGVKDPSLSNDDAWALLIEECDDLLTQAVKYDLRLAFEPEPGMFIEKMDQFARLAEELRHPRFGLTLDVGHVYCLSDGEPADRIREFAGCLFNVHIEDMRRSTHEHLMFGDGEMNFAPILAALSQIDYTGSVCVELSRHSHDAVNAAKRAYEFLKSVSA
jgi:sugar phosphate isomerase/epimerase